MSFVAPFTRSAGRHRARTVGLAAGVLAAGATGAVLAASPAHAAAGDPFAALRQCESGGNYSINTGNGFYGAYQFDIGTWKGLGYSGLPSAASPATQDAAAATLQAQRGWSPWPSCSKKLGLTSSSTAAVAADVTQSRSTTAATTSRSLTRTATPAAAPAAVPAAAPASSTGSVTFTVALANQTRADVKLFQQQLNTLGFGVVVDGRYGRATARAVSAFEAKYGLQQERVGVAGPQVKAKLASLVS